mmetsp:Transcript_32798/g.59552  ORF Transcript_32798/g.59552 Transcript_32798/m.59552 type:complete len:270 (-) Transcript_32798:662-1471(-)
MLCNTQELQWLGALRRIELGVKVDGEALKNPVPLQVTVAFRQVDDQSRFASRRNRDFSVRFFKVCSHQPSQMRGLELDLLLEEMLTVPQAAQARQSFACSHRLPLSIVGICGHEVAKVNCATFQAFFRNTGLQSHTLECFAQRLLPPLTLAQPLSLDAKAKKFTVQVFLLFSFSAHQGKKFLRLIWLHEVHAPIHQANLHVKQHGWPPHNLLVIRSSGRLLIFGGRLRGCLRTSQEVIHRRRRSLSFSKCCFCLLQGRSVKRRPLLLLL